MEIKFLNKIDDRLGCGYLFDCDGETLSIDFNDKDKTVYHPNDDLESMYTPVDLNDERYRLIVENVKKLIVQNSFNHYQLYTHGVYLFENEERVKSSSVELIFKSFRDFEWKEGKTILMHSEIYNYIKKSVCQKNGEGVEQLFVNGEEYVSMTNILNAPVEDRVVALNNCVESIHAPFELKSLKVPESYLAQVISHLV